MNSRKNARRSATALAVLSLILLIAGFASAQAVDLTSSRFVHYGLHYVAPGQTLRASVVNLGPGRSRLIDPCFDVEFVLDIYEVTADGSVRPVSTRSVIRDLEVESGQAASFSYTPPASTDPNGTVLGEFVSVKIDYALEPQAGGNPRLASDRRSVPQPAFTLDLLTGSGSIVAFPAVSQGLNPESRGM